MNRRRLLRQGAIGVWAALWATVRFPFGALGQNPSRWDVRRLAAGDEQPLVALMRASVADESSFHGRCNAMEWTDAWARGVIESHPYSLVVTRDEQLMAFLALPPKRRRDPSAMVERNQQAFWCGAGGVRSDLLLTKEESLRVFRHLLYRTFVEAERLGFEYVRCATPWERHPTLPIPFSDYPGVTMTSFATDDGEPRYLIEWRLADAVVALGSEGASRPL